MTSFAWTVEQILQAPLRLENDILDDEERARLEELVELRESLLASATSHFSQHPGAIEYGSLEEMKKLQDYATRFGSLEVQAMVARGAILNEVEAKALAEFFWHLVDVAVEEPDERWLEKLYNTLFSAFGKAGYNDTWDRVIPDD